MGFFFRRSFRKGPLRVNLSKSGLGWSLGVPGLRFGKSAKGRSYTRAGIPGTGVGWQSSGKSRSGCLVPIVLALGTAAYFILAHR